VGRSILENWMSFQCKIHPAETKSRLIW
jgi:hypothetical protein